MTGELGGDTIHHKPNGDTAMILYRLTQIELKLDRNTIDHEDRIRELEELTTRLSERMTLWQLGQLGFTIIASVIATVIGKAQ